MHSGVAVRFPADTKRQLSNEPCFMVLDVITTSIQHQVPVRLFMCRNNGNIGCSSNLTGMYIYIIYCLLFCLEVDLEAITHFEGYIRPMAGDRLEENGYTILRISLPF